MALEANVSFTYDQRGRMLLSNEPLASARRPAPLCYLGRTADGSVVRCGASVADHVVASLASETPEDAEMARLLGATAIVGGPAFVFSGGEPTSAATRLTRANRALVQATFGWLYEEIDDWQPTFGVVHDGAVVAVCFSSRLDARAAAAGVETLAEFRGRGFATAAVGAWGPAVRASGRTAFYGTSWDNLGSRGVARRLGLREFAATSSFS